MVWRGLVLVIVGLASCTTDHSTLARRPSTGGASGSGGSGGSGAPIGTGNSGNVPTGGRANPDYEPPGANALTIVNGVVDATSVRLCFARLAPDAETSELVGEPLAELAYAGSAVLTEFPGLDPAEDSIQPWVLAGDASLIDGLSCQAAVDLALEEEAKVTPTSEPEPPAPQAGSGGASAAGGAGAAGAGSEQDAQAGQAPVDPEAPPLELPKLRARPVPALPPGAFTTGRSVLMVLAGCLGGAAYVDAIDTAICGAEYLPSAPTLQPIVVKLSRDVAFDKVGLQAVHAALAVGPVDIRTGGDDGVAGLTFASALSYGTIQPRPADLRFGAGELGLTRLRQGLEVVADGDVIFEEWWSAIQQSSGLAQVQGTRSYTAVLVGPEPRVIKRGFWNDTRLVLVDNDPTRK